MQTLTCLKIIICMRGESHLVSQNTVLPQSIIENLDFKLFINSDA